MEINDNIIWEYKGNTSINNGYQIKKKTVEASDNTKSAFESIINSNNKKCPYSQNDRGGFINYKGVTFACDYEKNAITLGDVSNEENVLAINLPSGGRLLINRDNIGELSKAITMFTPEDRKAIIEAIQTDKHCKNKENAIEEEEFKTLKEIMSEYKSKIYDKVMNHESEPSFAIGASEFTQKQWDKVLENFDEAEEQIIEETKARAEEILQMQKQVGELASVE